MAKRDIPEINAGSMADIAFLLLIFFLVTTTLEKEKAMVRMLPKKEDEKPPNPNPPVVNKWDLLEVLVNDKGELKVGDEYFDNVEDLREHAYKYLTINKDANCPTFDQNYQVLPEGKDFLSYHKFDLPYIEQQLANVKDSVAKYEAIPVVTDITSFYLTFYQDQIKYFEDRKFVYEELGTSFKTPSDRMLIRVTSYPKTKYGMNITVQNQIQAALDQARDEKCKELWNISYEKLKHNLTEKSKPETMKLAADRKKVLDILVPGKIIEKIKK